MSWWHKIFISIALLGIITSVIGVQRVLAARSNQDVSLAEKQSYNGLFIRSGNTITIDGTVRGDVIVAGSSVAINGRVTGSVYAAAQTVNVRGEVGGNVHAAGNTVTVAGHVHGSLYAVASSVQLDRTATLDDGLVAAGASIVINGKVGSQVYVAGSNISLNNSVGGDMTAAGSHISINADAHIGGNFKYYSSQNAKIANSDAIAGSITRSQPPKPNPWAVFWGSLVSALFMALAWFLVGLVLLLLAPASTVAVAGEINRHPLKSFGVGLLFVIALPIAAIIGLVTVIGIPLAILAGLSYVIILMLGSIFTSLWFGRFVLSFTDTKLGHNALALAVGLVILMLVRLLPIFGGLVTLVVFFVGVGGLVLRLMDRTTALQLRQAGKKAAHKSG